MDVYRSQLYVEAEARMDSYETEDGQKRTNLNLLQRKSTHTCHWQDESDGETSTGNFETLQSKPRDSAEGSQ